MEKNIPSMDQWLREAKSDPSLPKIGMYLVHNGVVRSTAKRTVREGMDDIPQVLGMDFSYDCEGVEKLRQETLKLPGIFYARAWLNEGKLKAGDDIMYVLVGGDTRPHVIDALNFLVGGIKDNFVKELEIY